MVQITFTRWCIDPKGRTPISVDPTRVDATEHLWDAYSGPIDGEMPAATKIVMKNKQEYIVQGKHADVVDKLNYPAV